MKFDEQRPGTRQLNFPSADGRNDESSLERRIKPTDSGSGTDGRYFVMLMQTIRESGVSLLVLHWEFYKALFRVGRVLFLHLLVNGGWTISGYVLPLLVLDTGINERGKGGVTDKMDWKEYLLRSEDYIIMTPDTQSNID